MKTWLCGIFYSVVSFKLRSTSTLGLTEPSKTMYTERADWLNCRCQSLCRADNHQGQILIFNIHPSRNPLYIPGWK